MLTAKQIEKIAQRGWEIIIKKGCHPLHYRGWCLPDQKEVRIYQPAHESREDMAITIFHEMIHVRDGELKNVARKTDIQDNNVEREARETYKRRPKLLDFIAEMYALEF